MITLLTKVLRVNIVVAAARYVDVCGVSEHCQQGVGVLARGDDVVAGVAPWCARDAAPPHRRHSPDSCAWIPVLYQLPLYYHRNIMPKRSANALSLNLLCGD